MDGPLLELISIHDIEFLNNLLLFIYFKKFLQNLLKERQIRVLSVGCRRLQLAIMKEALSI